VSRCAGIESKELARRFGPLPIQEQVSRCAGERAIHLLPKFSNLGRSLLAGKKIKN